MPKNYNSTLVDNWAYPNSDIKNKNSAELKKEWLSLKGIEEKFSLNMRYEHCIEHVDCPFLYRFTCQEGKVFRVESYDGCPHAIS